MDAAQVCRQRGGRPYTSRLVDLAQVHPEILVHASDLGLTIELGISGDGKAYSQRLRGEGVDYVLLRAGPDVLGAVMPADLILSDRPECPKPQRAN